MELSSETGARFTNMSFLCACLVVLIHIEINPDFGAPLWWVEQLFAHRGMTNVAVPFYFLASGFFLAGHVDRSGWYSSAVLKRIRTLIVPFVLWNVLYRLFLLALEWGSSKVGYSPHVPFPTYGSFEDVVNALGINPLAWPGHPHLWFVRCLFVFVLISPLVVHLVRKVRCAWWWGIGFLLMVGTLLGVALFAPRDVRDVLSFYYSVEGLYYFALGTALRIGSVEGWAGRYDGALKITLPIGILLFFIPSAYAFAKGCVCDEIAYGFRLVATPFIMCGLWSVMPKKNVLGPLVGCAFPIYILHKFVLLLIAGFAGMTGMREYLVRESVELYFGRMILVVMLICLFVRILEKIWPQGASILFGGRTKI